MKIDARDSRGQAFVLTVLFMVGLLGISALVLDVGSWFRASRASKAAPARWSRRLGRLSCGRPTPVISAGISSYAISSGWTITAPSARRNAAAASSPSVV